MLLKKKQESIFKLPLILLVISYIILPIVPRIISSFLTTYFYMVVVIVTLFSVLYTKDLRGVNRYLMIIMPCLLLSLLTFFTTRDDIVLWGYKILLSVLPIAVGYYIMTEKRGQIDGLAKFIFLLLILTIITTIIGLIRFPGASRILATINNSQDADYVLYSWNNIGGYEFVYICVLLYPILILAYKRRRIKLLWTIAFAVALFFLVFLSEYATALILFIVSSCLFFLRKDVGIKGIAIFAIIGVLAVVFLSDVFADFLRWLADQLGSNVLTERLYSLAGGRTGLENSESERIFLYRESLNTFLNNPLFGTMFSGGYGSGGHSYILDNLAQYGLVGCGLMCWLYYIVYKNFIKPYSRQKGYGFVIWFFVQALVLSVINTGVWLETLTIFGPIFISFIYKKKERRL